MQQVVCRLTKGEPVKFISHLDWTRTIERALRRAKLPVAYTAGFNPRPRLAFSPPLSVGNTSEVELVAVELTEAVDPGLLAERLGAALPPGITVKAAWPAPLAGGKVTFGELDTVEYRVQARGEIDPPALEARAAAVMQAESVSYRRVREGRVKEFDARPLLLLLDVVEAAPGAATVRLRLRLGPAGTLRPEEALELVGLTGPNVYCDIHRTAIYQAPQTTAKPSAARLSRLLPRHRR